MNKKYSKINVAKTSGFILTLIFKTINYSGKNYDGKKGHRTAKFISNICKMEKIFHFTVYNFDGIIIFSNLFLCNPKI